MEKIYRVQMNSKGMPNFSTAVEIEDIPIYGNEHNCMMTIFGECSYAETGCGDCAVVEKVRKALSADRPQGEWIPCSERLPNIGEKVLASTKKTVFTQVFKGYHSDPKRWAWENNRVKEIEAWQPLPKLWKGADDEADNI